jgi:hypothetical protein
VLRDIDNDGHAPISTEAQFPKTRPLTFKNFMDYCHDFASAVWKQSEPDRLLYAGLVIGLTQDARGDIGSASEDLQIVLQQHRAMFSSKRQDLFASDATFKKHGPTTRGRPREKRLISNREKAIDERLTRHVRSVK